MPPPSITVRFLDRRQLLIGGATVVAACDTLELPGGSTPVAPGEVLDPITPTDQFYVTSCCGTPTVDRDAWSLEFRANGAPLGSIDLAGLEALDAREKEHTLQCIGGGPSNPSIGNALWSGLPVREIMDLLGVSVPASAVEIKFTGADGYETSVPVADLDGPMWLVWAINGEPLPDAHGTTARILNPGRYGTKNPKWITAFDFIDEPFVGYWERSGWSNDATYQPNGLIAAPGYGTTLAAGPVRVLGTAFAGRDPIARVQVSTDGGATFSDAEITYGGKQDAWTLWAFDWDAEPGEHRVRVRVTTASGATDTGDPEGTDHLHGYDGGMEIRVTVA